MNADRLLPIERFRDVGAEGIRELFQPVKKIVYLMLQPTSVRVARTLSRKNGWN